MKLHYIIIVCTMLMGTTVMSCHRAEKNELAHNHSESAEGHEEAAEKGHADHDEIIVEPETAAKFGIKTDTVREVNFTPSIQVTGQLLTSASDGGMISSPTSGVVIVNPNIMIGFKVSAGQSVGTIRPQSATGDDPNAVAKASIAAAKREIDRLKPLYEEGIVTRREYEAALSAYDVAKASFSRAGASRNITSSISGTINQLLVSSGQYVETGTPIATLSRDAHLILRADVPEKYRNILSSLKTAEIRSPQGGDWIPLLDMGGKRIDGQGLPSQSGYLPVYFSFKNDGLFSSGSNVEVSINDGSGRNCIAIPQSSLIEQQGENYVYVKVADHGYEKRRVMLGGHSGNSVEVLSGVKAGELLVTEGATVVKMAESSGAVPEGHSHNH